MRKIVSVILFSLISYASFSSRVIHTLSVEQGLSSRQVVNIRQDKKGFVWISTKTGVDRFDGHDLRSYSVEGSAEYIYLYLEDEKIYAYQDVGKVFRYHPDKDRFVQEVDLLTSLDTTAIRLHSLYVSDNNELWLSTDVGLFVMEDDGLHRRGIDSVDQSISGSVCLCV